MIQHLAQLREQAVENLTKKITLFNPSNKDFEWEIVGKKYFISAHDFGDFDFNVASILKKHLLDMVCNERDNPIRDEILKEIETIKNV